MRRGRWAEDPEALRRTACDGVIKVAALRGIGIPGPTIARRCRDGGPWRRLLPGVVLLHNGPPSRRQRLLAALRYGGDDAVVTGLQACRRHGVRRGPDPDSTVHLLVPEQRQLRTAGFALVERTTRMPRAVVRDEIPLAPPVRACLDAARRLRSPAEITELLADAVQRGMCSPAQLRHELRDGSQRGSATPREVLRHIAAGVRSTAERDARRLLARSRVLPDPWWNATVRDAGSRVLGVVDAWFDDVALAWEIDSIAHHLLPADFARTTKRAATLTSEGVLVVGVLPTALRRDPQGSLSDLEAAYGQALLRPRPPVSAEPAPTG